MFKNLSFDITVEADLKTIEFVDMKLSLNDHTVTSYKGRNSKLKYVNIKSNSPRHANIYECIKTNNQETLKIENIKTSKF